jgi:hypothetical protein
MGVRTGSRRAHRIAPPVQTRATSADRTTRSGNTGPDNTGPDSAGPDYTDAFAVTTVAAGTRTPEQWARVTFEGAPRPMRWFLLVGWRAVLGFHLGPRPSVDHVLGWRIVTTEPDAIRLELRSALMTGQLLLRQTEPDLVVLTTEVFYRRRRASVLWSAVAPLHRQLIPILLGRAASGSNDGSAATG